MMRLSTTRILYAASVACFAGAAWLHAGLKFNQENEEARPPSGFRRLSREHLDKFQDGTNADAAAILRIANHLAALGMSKAGNELREIAQRMESRCVRIVGRLNPDQSHDELAGYPIENGGARA